MFVKNLFLSLLISIVCLQADAAVPRAVKPVPIKNPYIQPGPDPTLPGDVVGRDLDVPIVGFFGHVGMWDGSSQIFEILNEGGNVIRINSLANFKTRANNRYWGAVSPNIPDYQFSDCFSTDCPSARPNETVRTRVGILKRAWQQYLLGADYTYGAAWNPGYPRESTSFPATRGLYRCDTFIIALYYSTTSTGTFYGHQTYPYNRVWEDRIQSIQYTLPASLFDVLATWQ